MIPLIMIAMACWILATTIRTFIEVYLKWYMKKILSRFNGDNLPSMSELRERGHSELLLAVLEPYYLEHVLRQEGLSLKRRIERLERHVAEENARNAGDRSRS